MNLITEPIAYTPVIYAGKVFTINQYRIHSNLEKSRPIVLEKDFLGLFVNLGKSFEYCADHILPGEIKKRQYNIVYVPKGRYEITTHPGIHRSLTIAVREKEFEGFAKDFSFLRPLADSKNIFRMVRQEHFPIAAQMETDITKLLSNHNKNPLLKNVATEAAAMSIFYDAINQIQFLLTPGRKYQGFQVETIRDVAEHLVKHLSQNVTIEELAETFGITKNRLQKGFREVFGKTVHEYIIDKRMEKAITLLSDPAIPISWIASTIGYKEVPNFTAAFKNRFKQSPSEFRGNDDSKS